MFAFDYVVTDQAKNSTNNFSDRIDRRQRSRSIVRSSEMNKIYLSADDAVADMPNGASVLLGGFGLAGIPENLIAALLRKGVTGLNTISNDMGVDGFGLGLLLEAGVIASHTGSYVGENRLLSEMLVAGKLRVNLIPQGTLAERIRAAGAGIPAFYTPAGVGTIVADGKEIREFNGRKFLLEEWLKADYALVKAQRGDRMGNLVYRKTAQNFNPMMAAAAAITIAEVEEIVEVGAIDPDDVSTPGVYVQRVVRGAVFERRIEHRTVRAKGVD